MCFQDKKYATDKYKDIYTELSIVKAKAERDLGRLRDQLQLAHEALGEPSLEEVERGGYGTEKMCKYKSWQFWPEILTFIYEQLRSVGNIFIVSAVVEIKSSHHIGGCLGSEMSEQQQE